MLQREAEAKPLGRGREQRLNSWCKSRAVAQPEDRSLDNTRHIYMCSAFERRHSKIRSLNDLAQKGISRFISNWTLAWGLVSSTNHYSFFGISSEFLLADSKLEFLIVLSILCIRAASWSAHRGVHCVCRWGVVGTVGRREIQTPSQDGGQGLRPLQAAERPA